MVLELAMESRPHHVLVVDDYQAQAPCVGDYVDREGSGWFGYVRSRRWTIKSDGTAVVRCWLASDPPRR